MNFESYRVTLTRRMLVVIFMVAKVEKLMVATSCAPLGLGL